jgi:hypothetical protein
VPARRGLVEVAGQPGQLRRVHHADRDRIAVPEVIGGIPLDGVREGMPVVQHLSPDRSSRRHRFEDVADNHVRLDADRPLDQLTQHVALTNRNLGVPLDEVQDGLVGDESTLDHLGQAAGELTGRQGRKSRQVTHDSGRFMEHTDQVLSLRCVDTRLPADRCVDHAEQRGRHVDHCDAAKPRPGDEASEIGRSPAADSHHRVGTSEPGHAKLGPAALGHPRGLGGLRVRDLYQGGLVPSPGQLRANPLTGPRQRARPYHRHPSDAIAQQRRQRPEQAGADQDVVWAGCVHPDPGDVLAHGLTLAAINSVTWAGSRSSVSTRLSATC